MMFPLVRELAADGIPVAVTCRVLKFSRQAFYAWNIDPVCDRDVDDAVLTNAAVDVHRDDPEFGYRFIADDLVAAGHSVSERWVWRLCSKAGLLSTMHRRRGRGKQIRSGPPVHDDLVERQFTADGINELWLTDITEHPTGEGKLYLCAVKDVCGNRIVGYSIDSRMKARLAVTGPGQRRRPSHEHHRMRCPFRPRIAIQVPEICGCLALSWPRRIDGPRRSLR